MEKTAVLSSAYLAPIQYYSKLINYTDIVLEQHENFIKQTYRNRCLIGTANGVISLSIPVDKGNAVKCLTKDLLIADENWQILHWRSIKSAYGSSPFFEYFEEDLQPFYEKRWKYLFDFNSSIQQTILELLGKTDISLTLTEKYTTYNSPCFSDFRENIRPKHTPKDTEFISIPYYQVFFEKFGFLPNLSIVDLLFNMGNESLFLLEKSFHAN